jgi:hypothetical protein
MMNCAATRAFRRLVVDVDEGTVDLQDMGVV